MLVFFVSVIWYKYLFCFRQITARINKLCYGLDTEHVDPIEYVLELHIDRPHTEGHARITKKVISGVYQGVTTVELDVSISPPSKMPVYSIVTYNRISQRKLQHILQQSTLTDRKSVV